MQFTADTMFPGDLFEAATRFAADSLAAGDRAGAWQQAVAMGRAAAPAVRSPTLAR
jgi:hypothetical protein